MKKLTDVEIEQEEYPRIITEFAININEYLFKNKTNF